MAVPAPNVRHAAIGFLIGFTLGAVRSNNQTAGTRVALGLLCGGLGAVIGAAVPSFSSHHPYPAWPDDEDDEMASRSKVAQPASPEPVPAGAATTSAAPTSPAGAP